MQVEHPNEEVLLGGGPGGDGGRPAGAGEHRQQGDDDHADQRMPSIDGRARILQFLKVDDDLVERDALKFGHVSPPAPMSWKTHRGRYPQKPSRAASVTAYQDHL